MTRFVREESIVRVVSIDCEKSGIWPISVTMFDCNRSEADGKNVLISESIHDLDFVDSLSRLSAVKKEEVQERCE